MMEAITVAFFCSFHCRTSVCQVDLSADIKEEDVKIAPVKLLQLNSRFHNKIQELNAQKLSIEKVIDQETAVPDHDCKVLKLTMKDLSGLK